MDVKTHNGRVRGRGGEGIATHHFACRARVLYPSPPSAPLSHAHGSSALASTNLAAVYEFHGSVNKMLVDEKGTLLLLAFGLPPLVHHDDPLRVGRWVGGWVHGWVGG